MDWQTISISFITSCIPAVIAYFTAINQAKTKLKESERNNQAEIEKMKLEYELKLKEKDNDSQNEFAMKFLTGELNLSKSLESIGDLDRLSMEAQKLQNSHFVKKKK